MNLLKYILFITTMLASNSLATDADDYAPDTLPLSEGSRRAFLLSTSVHASVNYVGDGLVRTPSAPGEQSESVAFPSTDPGQSFGAAPAELLARLAARTVKVGIANPNRPVIAVCKLSDSVGNITFHGEAPVTVTQKSDGTYALTQSDPIVLEPSSNVYVHVTNVVSAEITYRDDEGAPMFLNIMAPNDNNLLRIDTWPGMDGEARLIFKDGSTAFYSLTTGERQTTTGSGNIAGTALLANYQEHRLTPPSAGQTFAINMTARYEQWQRPVAPVLRVHTTKACTLRVNVTIVDDKIWMPVEPPTEWWHRVEQAGYEDQITNITNYDPAKGTCTLLVPLQPGTNWIYAEGEEFNRTYWPKDGKG